MKDYQNNESGWREYLKDEHKRKLLRIQNAMLIVLIIGLLISIIMGVLLPDYYLIFLGSGTVFFIALIKVLRT